MLMELDNADDRLNKTLEVLRNSIVDPAFNMHNPGDEDSNLVVKTRTLHDFVDDEGIENLKSRLRHSIDQVQVWMPPSSPLCCRCLGLVACSDPSWSVLCIHDLLTSNSRFIF